MLLLLGSAMAAARADPPRFAGEVQLRPPDAVSADGRFRLEATLKPAAAVSNNGRFTLAAALRPDAKAFAAVCGTDLLFSNGFEN